MNRPTSSAEATARSPFAGCAILIAALFVMVFLIGFSIVTLFRQFNEIAKFTGEKPLPVQVSPLENQESALNNLAERIETFRQQLQGTGETTLALTPDELNLAIAAYEPFKDLRGTFRILGADDGILRIAISFPLNGKPRLAREGEGGWVTSDSRYLNGTLIAKPALLQREIVLKIDNIEVPGRSVPREFIEQMSPYRITERYLLDPLLGPAMGQLTRVGVADGKLVFARVPGEIPADVIGKEQVDSATTDFFVILGIAACVFLLFAGVVVFLGLRAKARGISSR
jgi:hypothetical protein